MTKFSPNSLKFGLKVPHQVSCSAKEASAKIPSLSSLLWRAFQCPPSACNSVMESLSCSYDESVSVSMVFETRRMFGLLKMRNWCFVFNAKCAKGKGLWEKHGQWEQGSLVKW